jgi:hypothetical protein
MAIIGPLGVEVAHDGIVADFADIFLARHQRKVILVARKFDPQRLDRDDPARDLGPGAVDLGRAATAQHRFDAVGVVQQIAGLKDVAGWDAFMVRLLPVRGCRCGRPRSAQRLEFHAPVHFAPRLRRIEQELLAHAHGLHLVQRNGAGFRQVAAHLFGAQQRQPGVVILRPGSIGMADDAQLFDTRRLDRPAQRRQARLLVITQGALSKSKLMLMLTCSSRGSTAKSWAATPAPAAAGVPAAAGAVVGARVRPRVFCLASAWVIASSDMSVPCACAGARGNASASTTASPNTLRHPVAIMSMTP